MSQFLELEYGVIEYQWYGDPEKKSPVIILLHEGLGSLSMWKDFPQSLASVTGLGVLAYSRYGYGASDPCPLPRPLDFMEHEGKVILSELIASLAISEFILVGHSDGASISLIYAGHQPAVGLMGMVLMAPHVFVEEMTLASIREARQSYQAGPLREGLKRYHGDNVDTAFWGWNEVWLDPNFKSWDLGQYTRNVSVSTLCIQGKDDQYGSPEQVNRIARQASVEVRVHLLDDCGHSPHRDQRHETERLIGTFIEKTVASKMAGPPGIV